LTIKEPKLRHFRPLLAAAGLALIGAAVTIHIVLIKTRANRGGIK